MRAGGKVVSFKKEQPYPIISEQDTPADKPQSGLFSFFRAGGQGTTGKSCHSHGLLVAGMYSGAGWWSNFESYTAVALHYITLHYTTLQYTTLHYWITLAIVAVAMMKG